MAGWRPAAWCVATLALWTSAGCERSQPTASYVLIAGTVTSRLTDTGELTIEVAPGSRSSRAPETVSCVVTSDVEIYVRDQYTSLAGLEVGDRVEVIGQWQRDRLAAATIRVDRALPTPPIPAILTAETWPATQPAETRAAETQP